MDATHIPDYVTELDQQIADVERDIAQTRELLKEHSTGPVAKALRTNLSLLQEHHEQLVRRVQWATVGAAKPGEVL